MWNPDALTIQITALWDVTPYRSDFLLLGLLFDLKYESNMFFRNVSKFLPDYFFFKISKFICNL
jgi:hypothetical protein